MPNITDARKLLECAHFIEQTDEVRGYIRAQTALIYPDGSNIDVYFKASATNADLELTDLGTTMGWLMDMGIQPWTTATRRDQVDTVLRQFDAGQRGAEVVSRLREGEQLSAAVIRISQACARISDLYLTKRQPVAQFREVVEEMVSTFNLPYEARKELQGVGAAVTVDMYVDGPKRKSAIICIEPTRQAVDDATHKWYDLRERDEQKLTIYNDSARELDKNYLQFLTHVDTQVIGFSQEESIREILTAA